MKVLLLAFFIAATSATSNFDLSQIESKKLYVPENPDEFLTSKLRAGFEKSRDERIANGTDAVDGQFPYAVRMQLFETDGSIFVCSAVIIDRMYMLSVRHCFDPVLTYAVLGAVGAVDRGNSEMQFYWGSQFWFAPPIDGWNPDLAIIRMDAPFVFNDRVNYVRLPAGWQATYDFDQYLIQLIGWGRNDAGDMTQILQWAPFRIETACWQTRRPTHMCSEPVEGWHVATRGGDSGGPWVTMENGVPTLIALHEGSTGSQARWWFRGTRLSAFLNFINAVTQIPIRT